MNIATDNYAQRLPHAGKWIAWYASRKGQNITQEMQPQRTV